MQCIIMEKHSYQITHNDETKKRAHNSQTPINAFANRADPYQVALAYRNMIPSDPTLVDLTSIFCSFYKRERFYLYNHS